jgi:hypothetical protein
MLPFGICFALSGNKSERMKKLVFIAIAILLSAEIAEAQELNNNQVIRVRNRRSPTLSAGLQLAVPTGEFAEVYGRNLFGINAHLSFPLLNLPIEVGGGFAWNRMGGDEKDVIISDNLGGIQNGELQVNGNAYTYQIHGRLRPFDGKFRPYGEVFAGARNFAVRTNLKSNSGSEPSTEYLSRKLTAIVGYAIGAKYELTPGIFAEARFEKSAGSDATYIDPESVVINTNDGTYSYGTLSSRTDQWAISLGIAFSF